MYGAYKALGHYPDYWYWILRGRPSRSPHLLKQKVVREYGEKFALKTLVETGTYYGEMVAAMKSHFDRIYSIEFVPELAERAKRKFARDQHVRIFRGDSRVVMPEVLALLTGPALFWLDAGYYGWVGIRTKNNEQRLSAELDEGLCGIEVSAAVGGSEVRHHAHHAAGIANAAGDPAKAAENSGFVSQVSYQGIALAIPLVLRNQSPL